MKKNWAEIVSYLLLVLTAVLAYIDGHDIFTDKSMAGTMMILCILSCGFRMLDIYNNDDSMYPQLRLPDAGYIQ